METGTHPGTQDRTHRGAQHRRRCGKAERPTQNRTGRHSRNQTCTYFRCGAGFCRRCEHGNRRHSNKEAQSIQEGRDNDQRSAPRMEATSGPQAFHRTPRTEGHNAVWTAKDEGRPSRQGDNAQAQETKERRNDRDQGPGRTAREHNPKDARGSTRRTTTADATTGAWDATCGGDDDDDGLQRDMGDATQREGRQGAEGEKGKRGGTRRVAKQRCLLSPP